MPKEKFDKIIKSVGDFFGVLSHPDRIKILDVLKEGEKDVNEIREALGISQSRTSQHLKLLKFNSLVEERRDGKHVYYSLKNPNLSKVMETALQFQMIGMTADTDMLALFNELLTHWHI